LGVGCGMKPESDYRKREKFSMSLSFKILGRIENRVGKVC